MLNLFIEGFAGIASLECILLITMGVVLGIIFGACPGITTGMGLVLMLPMTYTMGITQSLALLLGLYVGGVSGGLITAVLFNIPGTPASVPTTFDGYPMAQNGQAGKALGIGVLSSFIGGSISFLFLFFLSPVISKFALTFSNVEYCSICLFSLMLVSKLSGKSLVKGIAAAIMGIMVSTVGMAPIDASRRFTFGLTQLDGGFILSAVLIGVYAVREVLKAAEKRNPLELNVQPYKMRGFGFSGKEFCQQIPNLLRSSVIGSGLGFLPGLGAGIASMVSYGVARSRSRSPEKFGTGIVDGIVASESANNAVIGGALIPLLTLGIPGDGATSILLAAFMLHGIAPSPLMFSASPGLIYGLFACLVIANILMIAIEYFAMPFFQKILKVPQYFLLPAIMVLCCVGAFGVNNRIFDVYSVLLFALLGYGFYKFDFPVPPLILGFILGPMVEKYFQRALMQTKGSFMPFVTRPVSALFLGLTAAYLISIVITQIRAKKTEGKDEKA